MTGAINLKPDFLTGRILINLDSEDEGILFIGCAGGMDTLITLNYKPEPSASVIMNLSTFQLQVCMEAIRVMRSIRVMAIRSRS